MLLAIFSSENRCKTYELPNEFSLVKATRQYYNVLFPYIYINDKDRFNEIFFSEPNTINELIEKLIALYIDSTIKATNSESLSQAFQILSVMLSLKTFDSFLEEYYGLKPIHIRKVKHNNLLNKYFTLISEELNKRELI